MKFKKIPGVFSKKFRFLKKKSIFLAFVTPGAPMGSLKKFSPFGPAVWPAIGKIYTNVLFILKIAQEKKTNDQIFNIL